MADPRFFKNYGPFTLGQLAELAGASLSDPAKADILIHDVASLDQAGEGQVTFLDNTKYIGAFETTKATACVVNPALAERAPAGMALLVTKDPYRAYAKIATAFYPVPKPESWIAPTAYVDPSAILGEGCRIDPGAYIGADVTMGRNCHIGPNAVIGQGVILGDDCRVDASATIQFSKLGDRVYVYTGARIGQDGFGFAMGPQGHLRVPQLGRVIIGNDVEVGANTTIDRGAGPDTIIGDNTMIDNQVQIGHNVQTGRGCVIVAGTGISGSTKLGDFVVAGGQSGFAGHLKIGSGARIAAQAGVTRDVPAGEVVGGFPAIPQRDWLRQAALLSKMLKQSKNK